MVLGVITALVVAQFHLVPDLELLAVQLLLLAAAAFEAAAGRPAGSTRTPKRRTMSEMVERELRSRDAEAGGAGDVHARRSRPARA